MTNDRFSIDLGNPSQLFEYSEMLYDLGEF
jgi:hypothetical protein